MGSIERAGRTEQGGAPAELLGLPIDSPRAQGALMLFSYWRNLKEKGNVHIDPANPEGNDEEVASAARDEWIAAPEGKESLAALYRAYIERHPHTRIDVRDDEALQKLLAALGTGEPEVRH